jgi:hypothetical protein
VSAYFGEKGVVHQPTARYSPEQNGVAERLNRVLMERARAMLIESRLPDKMWAEAVVLANYIRNRTPVSAHGKTPWEGFYGEKPDVSHMRVFGARAFTHVPGALRHNLEPVSEKGWFIGYETDARAYRILRERDNRMIISWDVIVDERVGSKPESEFGMDPVEAPGEEPENGNRFGPSKPPRRRPTRKWSPGDPGRPRRVRRDATRLASEKCPGSASGRTWRLTRRRCLRDLRWRLKMAWRRIRS